MMRLITVAKTGRRMKNSKIFISTGRGCVGYFDECTVPNLLVTGGDDNAIGVQALGNLCLAGSALAKLYFRQDRPVFDDLVNIAFAIPGKDCRFRDEYGIVAPFDDNLDPGKQAGKQDMIRIVDARPQPDGAAVRIYNRVNNIDFTLERPAWNGIDADADGLTGTQAGKG